MRTAAAMLLGGIAAGMLLGALAPENESRAGARYDFLPARQHLWVIDKERAALRGNRAATSSRTSPTPATSCTCRAPAIRSSSTSPAPRE